MKFKKPHYCVLSFYHSIFRQQKAAIDARKLFIMNNALHLFFFLFFLPTWLQSLYVIWILEILKIYVWDAEIWVSPPPALHSVVYLPSCKVFVHMLVAEIRYSSDHKWWIFFLVRTQFFKSRFSEDIFPAEILKHIERVRRGCNVRQVLEHMCFICLYPCWLCWAYSRKIREISILNAARFRFPGLVRRGKWSESIRNTSC